jgi:CHAT domain-containing protein
MLLDPVASLLGNNRLIIVADGVLQYIPFAALPIPGRVTIPHARMENGSLPRSGELVPLVMEHEIVSLPSAATIAVLREQLADRQPAPKTVALLADPVFSDEDGRVKKMAADHKAPNESTNPDPQRGALERAERDAVALGVLRGDSGFPRLTETRQEAIRIAALVPGAEQRQYLDFQASRATAMSRDLSEFRYVHFATHGLLDTLRPELSGIVLSLVDEQGRQQNGFLFAHEVYNLKLPAELVVLSGCQTGLGKEIKGEGFVGLTRGFMYAGAARVMASLWKVNDQATAELMERFYRGVLRKKQRPAEALRAAQIEMWQQSRWKAANYWAAFVLQGEWR